jgi:hypothetical protein
MALFGSLGKALGLGTAQQTMQGAAQGALRGAIMGQPFMGAASGALTGGTQQGQATAVSVPQAPPRESAMSSQVSQPMMPAMTAQPISYMQGVSPAVMRSPSVPSRSGVTQAGLPAIIAGGAAATRSIGGMLGLAGGALMVAPIILDPLTGEEKKLRVTRKLKANVKKAVEMFGAEFTAEQMGVDVEVIFYILTKRMRNDGPAVTKAALRKTRSTMRKLDAMCDMRDKMRPPARRAPARRTTSKVMQIKN